MFTGIVEGVGVIKVLKPLDKGFSIYIESKAISFKEAKIGDSIAINGVCLTAVSITHRGFEAHLSPETVACTTFKFKKVGDLVNIERALRLGDSLGGHIVTGHVDGIAKITQISPTGDFYHLEIEIPKEYEHYLIPKGSIAIDGISLTINEVKGNRITLMVIPHTYRVTTLHTKKIGDYVNFEIDLIAKMVYRWVKPYLKNLEKENLSTMELLEKTGFI
ncbi:MAG: riboflavin synthase [Caldimicrobium sp.]